MFALKETEFVNTKFSLRRSAQLQFIYFSRSEQHGRLISEQTIKLMRCFEKVQ